MLGNWVSSSPNLYEVVTCAGVVVVLLQEGFLRVLGHLGVVNNFPGLHRDHEILHCVSQAGVFIALAFL